MQVTPHDWCRVTPFGHPGITARLTAPPGLSRPPTSFIGSWCQGIHRPPLTTSPRQTNTTRHTHHQRQACRHKTMHHKDARIHYTKLNQQPAPTPPDPPTPTTPTTESSTCGMASGTGPGPKNPTPPTAATRHRRCGCFLRTPTGCPPPPPHQGGTGQGNGSATSARPRHPPQR